MFAHDKLVYRVVNNFDWVVPRCFSYFLLTRNFDLVIFFEPRVVTGGPQSVSRYWGP